jgi:hypothetical protein
MKILFLAFLVAPWIDEVGSWIRFKYAWTDELVYLVLTS